ncbi:MAG: TIGR04255 family protein [Bacteroidota bacterium]|nr:TIGR04255 family protein [Bacteroidota bacterium]
MSSRKYINPPVIEIVCEIRFKVKNPNDISVPGRFYEKIKDEYPNKEELHEYEAKLEFSKEDIQQKVRTKLLGMQYKTNSGEKLIRVAPNMVSAHHIPPYSNWEKFIPTAKKAFDIFREIVQPDGIERIGLRYIDRVEVPKISFDLSEYFKIYPHIPKVEDRNITQFFMRLEMSFFNGRDVLILSIHKSQEKLADKTVIILDWDYVLAKPEEVSMDNVLNWIEEAHDKVIEIFEESITDSCRQLFNNKQ